MLLLMLQHPFSFSTGITAIQACWHKQSRHYFLLVSLQAGQKGITTAGRVSVWLNSCPASASVVLPQPNTTVAEFCCYQDMYFYTPRHVITMSVIFWSDGLLSRVFFL